VVQFPVELDGEICSHGFLSVAGAPGRVHWTGDGMREGGMCEFVRLNEPTLDLHLPGATSLHAHRSNGLRGLSPFQSGA
jgi:hypothetical protein